MMKKLYKWDLIHFFNQLKWIVLGTLFVTILAVIFEALMDINFVWAFFYQTAFLISVVGIVVSLVYGFFVVLQRFYQSVLKDEGYFTHTLPISKGKILLAKVLSGFTLFTFSLLFAVGLLIWIKVINVEEFLALRDLDVNMFNMIIISILSMVIMFYVFIVTIYAALLFGFSYNHKEWLYVFVYFILYYAVTQFISFINFGINYFINPNLLQVDESEIFVALRGILIMQLIFSVGLGVANFYIARYLMTKKLNLKNG